MHRRADLVHAVSRVVSASAGLVLLLLAWTGRGAQPVLYSTDLFHPHEDPDDHFDLAVLYALPGIDLKGIILDQGAVQQTRPGRIPVSQLNRLTRREVPVAVGLGTKLKGPRDAGVDQAAEFQGGVRLILETLERAVEPVALVTVGSVRDVVAAFNRQPDLCRRKIGRVLCFIGEASQPGFREWNVELDPQAFVGLLRSGLPVDWVPCFDGGAWENRGQASFWKARHAELLERAPPGLIQYFIYALEKETAPPLPFLAQPVADDRRARLFSMTRNLWCTAVFVTLAGRTVTYDPASGVRFVEVATAAPATPSPGALFTFEDVEVTVTDAAVVQYGPSATAKRVRRFKVLDQARYGPGMTAATARLLSEFPATP